MSYVLQCTAGRCRKEPQAYFCLVECSVTWYSRVEGPARSRSAPPVVVPQSCLGRGKPRLPQQAAKGLPRAPPAGKHRLESLGARQSEDNNFLILGPKGQAVTHRGGVWQSVLPYMQTSRARDLSIYTFYIVSMKGAKGAVGARAPVAARGPEPEPWVWPARAPSSWWQPGPKQ